MPEVYRRVIDGETLPAIAAWLQAETGDPWWAKSVATLIRNPAYKGRRCERDPKTKRYGKLLHRCEPLVDAATWKRANDNLDARPKRGKIFAEKRAMLATALFCPVCDDSPMYRIKSGKGNTHLYYRCSGRGPQRKGCGLMVDAELVDAAANRAMAVLNEARQEYTLVPGHDHKVDLERIEDELADLPLRRLPRAEEQAERDRLWAEQDRVGGLPVVPDTYEPVATSESYAEIWATLPTYERGPWLTREHLHLTASHERVTVYATTANGSWQEQMLAAGPIPKSLFGNHSGLGLRQQGRGACPEQSRELSYR